VPPVPNWAHGTSAAGFTRQAIMNCPGLGEESPAMAGVPPGGSWVVSVIKVSPSKKYTMEPAQESPAVAVKAIA
jgi:hypothetical protein